MRPGEDRECRDVSIAREHHRTALVLDVAAHDQRTGPEERTRGERAEQEAETVRSDVQHVLRDDGDERGVRTEQAVRRLKKQQVRENGLAEGVANAVDRL